MSSADPPSSLDLTSTAPAIEYEWNDEKCMEVLGWCMGGYTSWKNVAVKLLQLTQGKDVHSGWIPPQQFFMSMDRLFQDVIFVWDPPKGSESNMVRAWKWAELHDKIFVGAILGLIRLIGLYEAHQVINHPDLGRWESSRQWLNCAILARNREVE